MHTRPTLRITTAFIFCLPFIALAQDDPRPLTIDDWMALKSVGSPQLSPDGEWVAYVVRSRDLEEDKSNSRIWMVPASGGEPIPMTAEDYSASDPKWSPDKRYLSFQASKGEQAKTQVW